MLAPRTPVRTMRDASGGRRRYGSKSGGVRDAMSAYVILADIDGSQVADSNSFCAAAVNPA